ncbi:hypothetical protein RUND412_006169 [Rhizina undulata]
MGCGTCNIVTTIDQTYYRYYCRSCTVGNPASTICRDAADLQQNTPHAEKKTFMFSLSTTNTNTEYKPAEDIGVAFDLASAFSHLCEDTVAASTIITTFDTTTASLHFTPGT